MQIFFAFSFWSNLSCWGLPREERKRRFPRAHRLIKYPSNGILKTIGGLPPQSEPAVQHQIWQRKDVRFLLHNFFAISFVPYAGILFLLIFLCANTTMDKHVLKMFFLLWILEFTELTVYNLELWTSTFAEPGFARMLLSALGYSVRILSIYFFLMLSMRNQATLKSRVLWALPAVVNALVAFSVFFSNAAFSFSPDNHFQRGPLGYTAHMIFLFYLVSIFFVTIKGLDGRSRFESIVICAIVLFIAISVLIATLFGVDGLGCAATVLATVVYYMFFQTQIYRETMFEEQKSRALFERQSKTDGATGLLNKTAFLDAANTALRSGTDDCIAVVFLDLDHFKNVNDCLGHLTGDKVIKDTAKKLQNVFRNADIIGRFGGDEFCAFLQGVPKSVLSQRLDEIAVALQMEYVHGEDRVPITASIGAGYCSDQKNLDIKALLELADEAAYEAKSKGGNGYVIQEYQG